LREQRPADHLADGQLFGCGVCSDPLNQALWKLDGKRLWVVKKLSDLEMSELRRIKDSTVLPLNLAVKTLLLT
jgi:hypothetical protein